MWCRRPAPSRLFSNNIRVSCTLTIGASPRRIKKFRGTGNSLGQRGARQRKAIYGLLPDFDNHPFKIANPRSVASVHALVLHVGHF